MSTMLSPKSREEFLRRRMNLQEHAGFLNPGEKPIYLRNEEGSLHSEKGPAYRSPTKIAWYRDGRRHGLHADIWGSTTYFWRGVMIPQHFYTHPKELTLEQIFAHSNTEVVCVGIEIYGYDRLESEGKFKVIDRDPQKEMVLYHYKIENTTNRDKVMDKPIAIIRLKNSTAEPDGTFKIYYLTVPPEMKTCREAVAWTFNKTEAEYDPILET